MKAIILAAGYATRLYPLTENQPKPLLEVNNISILNHILDKVHKIEGITDIYVVTNARFYDAFRTWHCNYPLADKITLINDGTTSNDDRLGAVGDIHYVVQDKDINDDLLVIAGDNLFGFELQHFINFSDKHNTSSVAFCDLKNVEKVRRKLGVGVLDGEKVIGFEEKPLEPSSALASTACYLFKKNDLPFIEQAMERGSADNSGDFVKFLVNNSQVHGFVFDEHWFDIGSFESLEEANTLYKNM
ncbi:nucleotidyltransferase family protein [Candidatus Woesearchaeota archaeon]|mgnify:CR=1 FL=1|jgi:glucose-1-phosphate thymidylyltransferase|nr:nucleotidyltransferase family protein [Candidatus Woesearchaeota archaeon]MBT5397273.1 nucleotidyltransferase family protein [Candidatus Woesearchaeota archaeon]MBT5924494.1 nucleotidyltransferase family protein [Candidatus Woesearchaeota archaeon]MBT6367181.1 nucleotidyltransferase family protein [Candidatus Woesearchaeota archaeon]MBT7762673.1 nucleotidyltransferase family protein [Candidatus Woesearchaeota archaeon]